MSQLVLPVGVTGLTVNGKTPTPEPGSIIRTAAVRFKERQENTHKVTFDAENTVTHKHTEEGISAAGMHMDFTSFFGLLRAASKGTQVT